jgi:plasmid maintenance system killer protein
LELAFATKQLRDLCENEATATRGLGVEAASSLRRRLADIRAALGVKDLVAGRLSEVGGTGGLVLALSLEGGYRITFSANHPKNPMTTSGIPDWTRISRVKLLSVETP